jgi:serpin B
MKPRFGARIQESEGPGVEVTEVKADSPAYEARLRPHDRIIRMGDWNIGSATDYANALDTLVGSFEGEVRNAEGIRRFTASLNRPQARAHPVHPLIANALWGKKGVEFLPTYTEAAATYYSAAVEAVDFGADPERARTHINRWIAEKTEDAITNLLPKGSIATDTALVLTNAISFQADWAVPFKPSGTTHETFFAPNKKLKVRMMHKTGSYRYGKGVDFQVLEIPYEGDFAMALVLPKDSDKFVEFEKQDFTLDNITNWIDHLRENRVKVSIPRFKIAAEMNLKKTLSELGMPTAFSKKADFAGMTGQTQLLLSDFIHKSEVEITEEGTKAAGGSAAVAIPRDRPVEEFTANRPFLFFIRDTKKGVILFVGRVVLPREMW